MARAGVSSDVRSKVRVMIVAEHTLVGEAVRAALSARGHASVVAPIGEPPPADGAEVGILLTHTFDEESSRALAFMEQLTIPWLVLAPEDRGPMWGAYYSSAASLVVPPGASLDDVCRELQALAHGRGPSASRGRRELIDAWHQAIRDREELNQRLGSLTHREHQVLRELHGGVGVRSIAEGSEVTEATVRTQVKAILRKLNVSSQIAAVAAYTQVHDDPPASAVTSRSATAAL
ncbi:helix-turn-helix transcriptional regulator [Nocardioides dilutus]